MERDRPPPPYRPQPGTRSAELSGPGLRCLVTGATGYIGGRLVPELLAAGHTVRCLARTPEKLRDHPWVGRRRGGPRRRHRRRVGRRRAARTSTSPTTWCTRWAAGKDFVATDRRAAEVFAERAQAAGVRRIVYLGGLTPAGVPEHELSPHLRSRAEVGRIFLSSGCADDRAAGRRHHRVGIGLLRDAALSDRAAAGDGHPELGAHSHPADRGAGRAALSRRLRPDAGRGQPGLRHRRSRRADVPGHDAALRGGRRAAPAADRAGAGADARGSPATGSAWSLRCPGRSPGRWRSRCATRSSATSTTSPGTCPIPRAARSASTGRSRWPCAGSARRDVTTRWSSASVPGAPSDPLPTDPDWAGGSLYTRPPRAHGRRLAGGAVAGHRGHRRGQRLVLLPARLGGTRLARPARRRSRTAARPPGRAAPAGR